MTEDEVLDLLTMIVSYDNRAADDPAIAAWGDAALIGRWTFDEAQAAVRTHYAASTVWLMPAHVTELVHGRRREAAQRAETAERVERNRALAAPLARTLEGGSGVGDPRHIGADRLDAIFADQGWSKPARGVRLHQCPHCRAAAGEPCTRPSRRADGGRVALAESHPSRTALNAPCSLCAATIGEECVPTGAHPHHDRDLDALGVQGRARRRARTTVAATSRTAAANQT